MKKPVSTSSSKKKPSEITFTRKKNQGFIIGDKYRVRFLDFVGERIQLQIITPADSKFEMMSKKEN